MAGYVTTSTLLNNAATFTSGWRMTGTYDTISGRAWADQVGTLHVEQSFDATNADVDTTYSVVASTGKVFAEPIIAPWFRLRYVNGGVNQGAFRLDCNLRGAGD